LGSGSTDANQFGPFTTPFNGQAVITGDANRKINAPTAATLATGGPNGATQPLTTNPSFPLSQTTIQVDRTGINPANATVGSATLSVVSWNSNGTSQFTLNIPSLGYANVAFSSSSLLKGASTVSATSSPAFRINASNTSYAALGLWEIDAVRHNPDGPAILLGAFVTGYETPGSAVPTTGTATYSATHSVTAIVTKFAPDGTLDRGVVLGDSTYGANFATGDVSGNLTNMHVIAENGTTTFAAWNDVSVGAKITAGTNQFNGSATASAVPSGATTPSDAYAVTATGANTAKGQFNGAFYGPNANELAGVWSLKDPSHVVIGVAAGRKQ